MFTRCTECKTIHSLTLEQLRNSRGMLRCSACSAMFDALIFISENEPFEEQNENSLTAEPLPWDAKRQNNKGLWTAGLVSGLLMLVIQLTYFESPAILQNTGFRLWAEKICDQVGFKLPDYQNAEEFEIVHRTLTLLPHQNYLLNVVFTNQAPFRQPYPNFHLTLLNFNGQAFAERVFKPSEYLSGKSAENTIYAGAVSEINLTFHAPKTRIGGYDFNFSSDDVPS